MSEISNILPDFPNLGSGHWEQKDVSRRYGLNVVLTMTTGIMLCQMDNICHICNDMTGMQLFTHDLVPVGKMVREKLIDLYPELEPVTVSFSDKPVTQAMVDLEVMRAANEHDLKLSYDVPLNSIQYDPNDGIEYVMNLIGHNNANA